MHTRQPAFLATFAIGTLMLLNLQACDSRKPVTEEIKDATNDALDRRPAEGIRDAAEDLKDGVQDAGKEIKDAAKSVADDIKK